MYRVLLPALVCFVIVNFIPSKAFSQTAAPDSLSIEQQGIESIKPGIIAPVEVKAVPYPAVNSAEDSLRLEGFSMYNFGAAYFYSRQKMTEYDWWDGTSYTYTYTTTILAAGASWNYMVYNGLSLGGSLGLVNLSVSRSGGIDVYFSYSDHSSSSSLTLVGPRIAQYFGKKNSKFIPFVAGEMDIITSSSGMYSNSEAIYRIGGGSVIKILPSVGLSLGLDYLRFEDQKDAVNIMGTMGLVCMPFELKK